MKRLLLISSFLLPLTLCAERSAFGAGDLDNPNPYGLTKAEKKILENKEVLANVKGTSRKNKSRLTEVEESLAGVKSIVEGMSESGREERQELQTLKTDMTNMKLSSTEMNDKIDGIILTNEENINQLKLVMGELSSLIDTINTSYVSKAEYNKLAQEINSFKLDIAKQLKKMSVSGNSAWDNKSSASVATEAKKLFDKKKYADAIDAYEHLIKKGYKPAAAHYYIGESYFQLNEYTNAIAYFKESAKRYSKGKYMPKLMLHTAIALQKTQDEEGAQQFFQAVVVKYPASSEAKKAEKFIK
jgi:TolA-binding protein